MFLLVTAVLLIDHRYTSRELRKGQRKQASDYFRSKGIRKFAQDSKELGLKLHDKCMAELPVKFKRRRLTGPGGLDIERDTDQYSNVSSAESLIAIQPSPLITAQSPLGGLESASTGHTRKRRWSSTRPSKNSDSDSIFSTDTSQSTSTDATRLDEEEPSAPAQSTERLDGARCSSSLPAGAFSLHGPTADSPCTSGQAAGMPEQAVDSHRSSAGCVSTENLNESDSRAAEILSELRSRSDILNIDRGSHFPRYTDSVPQVPTLSAPNMQTGSLHPINGKTSL